MPPPSSAGLLSQSYFSSGIPERGEGVNEEARLHAALLGVYECVVRQVPPYRFGFEILYNQVQFLDANSRLDGFVGTEHYAVEEEGGETARSLVLDSLSEGVPIGPVEIVPLANGQQPIDFESVEVSETRRMFRYGKDIRPETLKIRVPGISVIDSASVGVRLTDCQVRTAQFEQPLKCFISRTDAIRVDLVNNFRAEARGLDEHLLALFANVFGKFVRAFRLACSYRYAVSDAIVTDLPVLLLPHASVSESLCRDLSDALKAWYRTNSPARGVFVFQLTVFGDVSTIPVLILSQLLLPVDSLSDLP